MADDTPGNGNAMIVRIKALWMCAIGWWIAGALNYAFCDFTPHGLRGALDDMLTLGIFLGGVTLWTKLTNT